MQRHIALLAFGTASLALAGPLSAQVHFDGLPNSAIGASQLSMNAADQLVVDNLGSSGKDGVRIDLGDSQGASASPAVILAPNEECTLIANAVLQGATGTSPVSLLFTGQGAANGTLVLPDFSSIGQQTYTMRVIKDGQVVYEQGGQSGPARLSNHPNGDSVPQYVYMLGGIGDVAFLNCVIWEGGNVAPPGGGNPIACDLVEFEVPIGPVISIESMDMTLSGPTEVTFASEAVRILDHFVHGLDDAHLEPQGTKLKVSNLGSSGCDGVSIAFGGGGDNQVEAALEPLSAPNNPGACITAEAIDAGGHLDSVKATASGNSWEFTPDFSQIGAASYTLELYHQGQLVFSQGTMTGHGVSTTEIVSFYKKKVPHLNGSSEVEWCIGGSAAQPHTVAGGPTVLADMFVMRSEGNLVLEDKCKTLNLRIGDPTTDIVLTSIDSSNPPCVGTNYCISAVNSTGFGAVMCSSGSSSVADNDLTLIASGVPANNFGIFFYGPNQVNAVFGNGFRCVGGGIFRLPISLSSAAGVMSHNLDNTSPPLPAGQISAGEVWNFQAWYRDTAAGGAGFNLSDGHWILFTP